MEKFIFIKDKFYLKCFCKRRCLIINKNVWLIGNKLYEFKTLKEIPKNYVDLGYKPLIIYKNYCKTVHAYYNNREKMMTRVISYFGLDIMTIYIKNYFTNDEAICYEIDLINKKEIIRNQLKYINDFIMTKDAEKLFQYVLKQLYKYNNIYKDEINCLKQLLQQYN